MVDEAAKKARAEYLKKYLSKDNKSVTKKHKKKKTDNSRTGLKIHEDDAFAVVAPCANHVTSDDESEKDVVIIQNAKSKEAPKFKRAAFESVDIKTEVSAIRKRHDTPSDEELHDVLSLPGSSVQLKQRNPDSSYPDRHIITKKNGQNSSQDSDASPPRRQIKDEPLDSDPSPPRRSAINAKLSSAGNTDNDSDTSLPRYRKRTGDSHSDTSSSRRRIDDFKAGSRVEKSAHYSRRKRRRSGNDDSPRRTYDQDSDASPPRIRDAKKTKREHHRIIKEDYRQRRVSTTSEAVSRYGKNDQSYEGHKRPGLKTLEEHREEMKKLEENEGKMLKDWNDYIDGKNAAAVRRTKMTGKGRQTKEDREKKEREAKKQQELEEKYEKWNKGLKQIKERADKLNEMARVVQEDFARHVDNKAMNEHMKEQLYEKDPMFNYVKRKKDKTEIKRGTAYPKYKGSWPPNRYNIAPGYRWDGVNRSNGFEDKIAEVANRKAAQLTEYYENIAKYEV